MASSTTPNQPEIAVDFSPMLIVYKDGTISRLMGNDVVPTSLDPNAKVLSKDVTFSTQDHVDLKARLFLPTNVEREKTKLPLLVYIHGGGFCIETPFSNAYHSHMITMASEANVVVVSVDYRRAPEHPLPIAYDDSWAALKWVASHFNGGISDGGEEWLRSFVDPSKVFIAGDSAGANISHQMVLRNGKNKIDGINIVGAVIVHPYFWGIERIGNGVEGAEGNITAGLLWQFVCPSTSGCDDPLINPAKDPDLGSLGCSKVLVFVAEKDLLRDRGVLYYEELKKSGFHGNVEIVEHKGENHVFHLFNPSCENAAGLIKKFASFINED